MNYKLIFKTLFVIGILSLFVIMGLHNRENVQLYMPELYSKPVSLQAALMYFSFFGGGFLAGTIIMVGGGGGGSKKSSSSKKD